MIAPAEVIFLLMQDHRSSKDIVGTSQGNLRVNKVQLAVPVCVERHVAEVTNVAVHVIGMAVLVLENSKPLQL